MPKAEEVLGIFRYFLLAFSSSVHQNIFAKFL